MQAHVARWGNSLAVRIPRLLARELGLESGQPVDLEVNGDTLTVRPRRRARLSLRELLEEVTDNLHEETDWGPPVGLEEW